MGLNAISVIIKSTHKVHKRTLEKNYHKIIVKDFFLMISNHINLTLIGETQFSMLKSQLGLF